MRTPPPGQEEVDKACSRRLLTAGAVGGKEAGQREGVGQGSRQLGPLAGVPTGPA